MMMLTDKYYLSCFYGGRGAGKTHDLVNIEILRCMGWLAYPAKYNAQGEPIEYFMELDTLKNGNKNHLFGRKLQRSIKDSLYSTVVNRIRKMGLSEAFEIRNTYVRCIATNSTIKFSGLTGNPEEIKSIEDIHSLFIDEGRFLTHKLMSDIFPSIRGKGCRTTVLFNTGFDTDPVYEYFVKNPPRNDSSVYVKKLNYYDNPFYSNELERWRLQALERHRSSYRNVWLGYPIVNDDSKIFKDKWVVEDFEECKTATRYRALDLGFVDATAALVCYIKDNRLYITDEAYEIGLDIDRLIEVIESKISGFFSHRVYVDGANLQVVATLNRRGARLVSVKKGAGSILAGIASLLSFEKIVIHKRCVNMIDEVGNYSWEVDENDKPISGKIKKNQADHLIDCARYAISEVQLRGEVNLDVMNRFSNFGNEYIRQY